MIGARLVTLTLVVSWMSIAVPGVAGSPICGNEADVSLEPLYIWIQEGSLDPLVIEIWSETNGHSGLQRSPCVGMAATSYEADELVERILVGPPINEVL